MCAKVSQITNLTTVYSIVYSDVDQRKHQSSASLAFVRGIHRGPVNSPHKWPVTRKVFPFDDGIHVIAWTYCRHYCHFVIAIRGWPVDSPHKGTVTQRLTFYLLAWTNYITNLFQWFETSWGSRDCNDTHRQFVRFSVQALLLKYINFNPSPGIPAWMSNHIHYTVRGEITYRFPNFNGKAFDVGSESIISSHTL